MTATAGHGGHVAAGRLPPAHEVVEEVLAASRSAGCVAIVEDSSQTELRFARNSPTTNGLRRDRRVTVISIRAGGDASSVGAATRSGRPDTDDLVRASELDAESSEPAEDASPLVEGGAERSFDDPPVATSPAVFAGVVTALAGGFKRARSARHVLAGYAEHRIETVYLGTSTGLRSRHVQPTGSLEVVARSSDGSRSAWVGQGTADFADIDLGAIERGLVDRLSWGARPIELPAGRYEVLLPPSAVGDLMVPLIEAAGGRDAEDGRSAFSRPGGGTRVGEAVSDQPFELWSDPVAVGVECAPFLAATASGPDVSVFDNGFGLAATRWLQEGKVHRLRYHRAGAERSGVPAAPPIDNVLLEIPGAGGGLEELISRTGRALLLTCLWYVREVDPVTLLLTGLTRDGVFLIEGGEVVGAVNNFRFNMSPLDVLARTLEAGRRERALPREFGEWYNRTSMPALRVADFNMSSVSLAT